MLRWLFADAPGAQQGGEFAAYVFDGWGEENLKLIQSIGAAGIVELYRGSPFWATIAGVEAKFRDFVAAFVDWEPTPEDQPEGDHEEMAQTFDLFPAVTLAGEVVYSTLQEAMVLNLSALLRRIVRASLNPPGPPVPSAIIFTRLAELVEKRKRMR